VKRTMAASNFNTLKICSFNMYGYAYGLSMVQALFSDYDIILLQETWLSESNMDKLNDIDPEFISI